MLSNTELIRMINDPKMYDSPQTRQQLRELGHYVISPASASSLKIYEKKVSVFVLGIYNERQPKLITVYFTQLRSDDETEKIASELKRKLEVLIKHEA